MQPWLLPLFTGLRKIQKGWCMRSEGRVAACRGALSSTWQEAEGTCVQQAPKPFLLHQTCIPPALMGSLPARRTQCACAAEGSSNPALTCHA